jgi:hypothetical protein
VKDLAGNVRISVTLEGFRAGGRIEASGGARDAEQHFNSMRERFDRLSAVVVVTRKRGDTGRTYTYMYS